VTWREAKSIGAGEAARRFEEQIYGEPLQLGAA
jgi:hypothetical protein